MPERNLMTLRSVAKVGGIVLSLVAIAIVVAQSDPAATAAVLARAVPGPILVALMILVAQLGVLAYRWRLLLPTDLAGRPVAYRAVAEALLVGNLGNALLPGRLGEVARAVAVARRSTVDPASSIGTVVLERVLDIAVLADAAFIAAMAAGAPTLLSDALAIAAAAGTLSVLLILSGVAASIVDRLADWARRRFEGARREAALAWVVRLVDGVHAGQRTGIVILALAATTVSVLMDGALFWAVGASFGLDLDWGQALLLATAGILVTGIPSAPANIGTFELAVAWVAGAVGIGTETGLAIAVVAHLIIVVPLSLAGGLVLLASFRRPGNADKLGNPS